ncbi:PREDICTED: WAP four-disulfide core domain protein 5-like [Nanorana parkeri]|uniref:WAP four-disulfide core domain protein 5-like n=1 Tax=Nanorana parkeri TaxID=125878 RepID=UPI00085485FC|nr:PREDICTED: WAP four-disulfide core domain protein 5-like [Nanorana parkeri]
MSMDTGLLLLLLLSCAAVYAHNPPNRPDPKDVVKPGRCKPPTTMCSYPARRGDCRGDGECPGNLKCCISKCVYQCVKPERSVDPPRPGPPFPGREVCPKVPRIACMQPWLKPDCRDDRECRKHQKCCDTPCVKRCTNV